MKRVIYAVLLLLLITATFLAGRISIPGSSRSENPSGRKVLYYVDPMNPGHTSDKPGIAPCGMKMEPVYADATSPSEQAPASAPPGTVRITPDRQQLIGVKVAMVTRGAADTMLRTTGRVAADETRVSRIVATSDGWIGNTFDKATGAYVKKGEQLASLYSAGLLTAQRTYFQALVAADAVKTRGKETAAQIGWTVSTVEQPLDALRTLGMGEEQIREITRTREYAETISLVSPVTGYILARNVSSGQRFEKGSELYRIADLRKVWVLADLYGDEARRVRPGNKAMVSIPGQKSLLAGVVGPALPLFDQGSRTLKVRLELENPDYALKPDMFVDVMFHVAMPEGIIVPPDALLDSGLKKRVFVDRGNGFFEPREVETGWRTANAVEITHGLEAGERVVVSGSFLIDSESRMKMAAAGTTAAGKQTAPAPGTGATSRVAGHVKDPVCGMTVDVGSARAAGLTSGFGGKEYHFCSVECKTAFAKQPDRYAPGQGQTTAANTPGTARPVERADTGRVTAHD
jgi:RND family efflux transporter MFP subunit